MAEGWVYFLLSQQQGVNVPSMELRKKIQLFHHQATMIAWALVAVTYPSALAMENAQGQEAAEMVTAHGV